MRCAHDVAAESRNLPRNVPTLSERHQLNPFHMTNALINVTPFSYSLKLHAVML